MIRRLVLMLGLGLSCSLLGCATIPPISEVSPKKLIEFGWDEPNTAFMRRHIAEMERSPFDGCVFHVTYAKPDGTSGEFMWEGWGTRAFTQAEVQSALDDLQAIHFRRFTHNFLRFNTVPGDVDWFDDFSAILTNARLAAQVARAGKARGLLFDVEQYKGPLFDYRKQRDAATKSWSVYAAQVRQRGREVMNAFQQGYPDVTVFLTFGYSVPWRESGGGKKPLADGEYGLLPAFLDGMVEAARGRTRLVDGYEIAYYHNKDTTKFAAAYQTIREELLPIVANPKEYRRRFSVSFGLWMDFDSTAIGWDGEDGSRNFYTPEEFGRSVRKALEVADEYVWIYSQIPRWWSSEGKTIKLPEGYADALRQARQGLAP
ncbi:MAG TPA: hypothetical protein VLM91_14015 [Candidatus Methylomirabilis sp.]|nr:hypothetical protein [Candidatus Methylomirabilis sp.]